MFLLLIILITKYLFVKEGFKSKLNPFIIVKKDYIIYDDDYVNIYDDLLHNKEKSNYEINTIINKSNITSQSKILDIGCGTGNHLDILYQNDSRINTLIGIDSSKAMIKNAKEKFPLLTFKLSNALNTMDFTSESFSHILCLNNTIYYIKNKILLLSNCYNWLMPGGILILNLVNSKLFNAITPLAYETGEITPNIKHNERHSKCNIQFTTLDYKSDFNLDETIDDNNISLNKPNALLKETFKFKNSNKIRINEQNLFMSSEDSILRAANKLGFIIKSKEKYKDIKYKQNFLYILEKP